ncbi:hypothetical protein GQ457_06G010080 [Hibiscus cannabinus]
MTNPNDTFPPLTYDNPSGRPPEEGVPIVVAPMLERPASPTPLERQNLVKKGRSDSFKLIVATGDAMEADGELISEVGVQEGSHVFPLVEPDNGKSNLVAGPLGSGKATYASVIDKGSSESKPSDTEYD